MSQTTPSSPRDDRTGLAAGLGCYFMWGLLPLLFQAAERAGVSPWETVAWRTVFGAPIALALVAAVGQAGGLVKLPPRTLAWLGVSAVLIGVNWLVYVWAVDTGRTLEGSLGYYINPLLNMAAGRLLFGERIDRFGWAAIALATVGVALQTAALHAPPWVSLALALSFCGYGVVRKRVAAPAQTGLFVECAILAVPAAAWLLWSGARGGLVFGAHGSATALLLLTGPATVAPLACFAIAARRLPLTLIGFLQFLAPTLQFVVGVANGEALTPLRALSFVFIWGGVAVFAAGALHRGRVERAAARAAAQPA
jgi:chloramphenicol-sensitive protein RarD